MSILWLEGKTVRWYEQGKHHLGTVEKVSNKSMCLISSERGMKWIPMSKLVLLNVQ